MSKFTSVSTLISNVRKIFMMPFYAVSKGRTPGVFTSWTECEQQVKGFSGAKYKKFSSEEDARAFVPSAAPKLVKVQEKKPSLLIPSQLIQKKPGPPLKTILIDALPKQGHGINGLEDLKPVPVPPNYANDLDQSERATEKNRIVKKLDKISVKMQQLNSMAVGLKKKLKQLDETVGGGTSSPASSTGAVKRAFDEDQSTISNKRQKTLKEEDEDLFDGSDSEMFPNVEDPVIVYTDGCCHSNGRNKAAAGIGVYWGPNNPNNVAERLDGRQTNNRAEIHAACKALRQARQMGKTSVIVKTDSKFMINSITKWIHKWKKNGWKLADGGDVKNKEDFTELDELQEGMTVKYVYVEAHKGIQGNEMADQLANQGARKPYHKNQRFSFEDPDSDYE